MHHHASELEKGQRQGRLPETTGTLATETTGFDGDDWLRRKQSNVPLSAAVACRRALVPLGGCVEVDFDERRRRDRKTAVVDGAAVQQSLRRRGCNRLDRVEIVRRSS
ncbi:unnamed protein product [Linum trigynum]|uniref:Uncharacterized protein n=1 Tax=Linum trigynum TaxID=586398 RepID=A0AAV2FDU0_9ROSI